MSSTYDIGFLGGGQLARMSIQAAQRFGLRCLSLDPGSDTPASQIAASLQGELGDAERLTEFIQQCDRVTLENEFVNSDRIREAFSIANLDEGKLMPGINTLHTIQDKLRQRKALSQAGVPSPNAVSLDDGGDRAIEEIKFPMVIKVRFGGYDGKGTRYAASADELKEMRYLWGEGGWMAEQFVPFKRELAVMVYVGKLGAGCFPTMESVQANHVCDLVYPSGVDASEIAVAAVEAVGGKGLFGVELFELDNDSYFVNEIAPRPHNTGHYTLDWGGVSQFEQHIRLVMDWPLVEPHGGDTCMANLFGKVPSGNLSNAISAALTVPNVFLHWYGKSTVKAGRKMGHINALGPYCIRNAVKARGLFYRGWESASLQVPS